QRVVQQADVVVEGDEAQVVDVGQRVDVEVGDTQRQRGGHRQEKEHRDHQQGRRGEGPACERSGHWTAPAGVSQPVVTRSSSAVQMVATVCCLWPSFPRKRKPSDFGSPEAKPLGSRFRGNDGGGEARDADGGSCASSADDGEGAGESTAARPPAWSSIQRRFSRIASVRRSSSVAAWSTSSRPLATSSPTSFSSVAMRSHSGTFGVGTARSSCSRKARAYRSSASSGSSHGERRGGRLPVSPWKRTWT